jgi:hypothetical protein
MGGGGIKHLQIAQFSIGFMNFNVASTQLKMLLVQVVVELLSMNKQLMLFD